MKASSKYLIIGILGCLYGISALGATADEPVLEYHFTQGSKATYHVNISTASNTTKTMTSSAQAGESIQTAVQDMVIEETIKKVDMTGDAEILVTFKAAKMDAKTRTGPKKETQMSDTLKYLEGGSITAYVTGDGKVIAVSGVEALVSAVCGPLKDQAAQTMILQTYTQDFFKDLLQNLYPQFPLDISKPVREWEIHSDIVIPRTDFKLRITTKSSIGQMEGNTAEVFVRGDIQALPVDVDAPTNPSAPLVEVLGSNISGNWTFSLDQSCLVSCQMKRDLTLHTAIQIHTPSAHGNEYRSDVFQKTHTVINIQAVK